MNNYRLVMLLAVSLLCLLPGCVKVKSWEKKNLVKSHMAFDPDPLEASFHRHVYESKEGASGGYGVSSVGCGCK